MPVVGECLVGFSGMQVLKKNFLAANTALIESMAPEYLPGFCEVVLE